MWWFLCRSSVFLLPRKSFYFTVESMRPGPSPGSRIFQISVPVPVPDPANFEFESRSQSQILKWVPVPDPDQDYRGRDFGILGILSRMPTHGMNYYSKMMKKYPLYSKAVNFIKILSISQGYFESLNNLMKFSSKNDTLYGVYLFLNFRFCLNWLIKRTTFKV